MNRQQKIDQIEKKSGKVSKISNLEIKAAHIHPDYRSEPCDGILSETGKLEVLKVVSKSGVGPYFVARWDHRPEHLDIDVSGVSKTVEKKFKNKRDGYCGHHTNRSTDPHRRVFDVKIETPTGVIFAGTLSFSNTYDMSVVDSFGIGDKIEVKTIRAGKPLRE